MSKKEDCVLPPRTPQFASRETCAAEFDVCVATWDDWVKSGIVPKPYMLGKNGTTPRWSWDEIREYIMARGKSRSSEVDNPHFNPQAFRGAHAKARQTENGGRKSA